MRRLTIPSIPESFCLLQTVLMIDLLISTLPCLVICPPLLVNPLRCICHAHPPHPDSSVNPHSGVEYQTLVKLQHHGMICLWFSSQGSRQGHRNGVTGQYNMLLHNIFCYFTIYNTKTRSFLC
uniref:Uncharacterized protein n=1 Tax=Cacopsylla melanoneura TaxID=428564 RepID=A0A8D8PNN8_9HEMI